MSTEWAVGVSSQQARRIGHGHSISDPRPVLACLTPIAQHIEQRTKGRLVICPCTIQTHPIPCVLACSASISHATLLHVFFNLSNQITHRRPAHSWPRGPARGTSARRRRGTRRSACPTPAASLPWVCRVDTERGVCVCMYTCMCVRVPPGLLPCRGCRVCCGHREVFVCVCVCVCVWEREREHMCMYVCMYARKHTHRLLEGRACVAAAPPPSRHAPTRGKSARPTPMATHDAWRWPAPAGTCRGALASGGGGWGAPMLTSK